ncbi:flagellin [Heyndrickxia coagulans]|uniref:flagellin N-terminal helical domain-containing protein n=1 Tax=Heyndrickxia coagulans TaxID=1398 RepID=UPI002E1D2F7E|nr:flagellin [Heyndrickxia coagulans]MED4962679.1 flagellin [Heyndrickxia coagulans]
MIINHNIAALNTLNHLNAATNAQSKAMQKLSSGLRINSAADDAAGLAISEKMRSQIRGLNQATSNAQDASSLAQTAEGALNETTDILQRMRELATQAANDTNTTDDREQIQKEMNQLTSEINRIGNTTEFNTQKLLDGSKTTGRSATSAQVASGDISSLLSQDLSYLSEISVNGQEVTLTATKQLNGSAAALKVSDLVDALQKDINSVYDGKKNNGVQFTVEASADGKGITITNNATGSDSIVAISGASASTLGLANASATGTDESKGLKFQIGANENQSITLKINDMRSVALGISSASAASGFTSALTVTDGTNDAEIEHALDVSSADSAAKAITTIDQAIKKVSTERANLGAFENRLDHTVNNLTTASENLTSAESRIRDVDMAKEMSEQMKQSILAQAAQAMLAQANQQPQQVLQLLR